MASVEAACIEDIDYPAARKLDKKLVRQLASCKWITLPPRVITMSGTGTWGPGTLGPAYR